MMRPNPAAPEKNMLLPLTAAQYGIWLGQKLDPSSPAYWTAEALTLRGALDVALLEAAARRALAESDALHMRYECDGDAVFQTLDPARPFQLSRVDFRGETSPWLSASDWMARDLARAADIEAGPLIESAVLTLGADHHALYLRAHHVALDGFGYSLVFRRVVEIYAALRNGAEPPPARPSAVGPVVQEDLAYRKSPAFERDRAFWQERLWDVPSAVLLSPPTLVAHRVARSRGDLPANTVAHLQPAAAAARVDWAGYLIAAVTAWLFRETGATDITLGLPVMGRLGSVALTVPCMAMNIVPLRLRVDPSVRFADLARQVSAEMRAIRPHHRYRYEDLKHDLGYGTGSRRLFGPVVNLMPFDPPPKISGLDVSVVPVSAGPVEDLALTVAPRTNGLRFDIEANPDAYTEASLAEHRAALLDVIDALTNAPDTRVSDLPGKRISRASRAPAIVSGGALREGPISVLARLRATALATPEHVAVEQDGEPSLTYAALVTAVQKLASRLAAAGVTEDSVVVLFLPRAPETIVALLSVLWAGGGYLPLDPDGPPARVAMALDDARPALVITRRQYRDKLPSELPVLCLDEPAPDMIQAMTDPRATEAGALAYVIYTSGSTGRPNGVMIGRDALAHFLAGASERYRFQATDRVMQFAPLQFDASVEEVFLTLAVGATLVLRTDAMLESLTGFLAACEERKISVLDLPTAFWHELAHCVTSGDTRLPACVRLIIIGGEAALAERMACFQASVGSSVILLNTYGPTETTVVCTTAEIHRPNAGDAFSDPVPIGWPLPGLDAAIVDASLKPVAWDESGELCIIGPTLARGYVLRDEQEARRFVRLDSVPGAPRAYRTGDRVRLGPDGALRFIGRLDDEIKISGYRVDPAEVEAALLDLEGIREACVVCHSAPNGNKRLKAFVAGAETARDPLFLRAALATRLHAPAIPAEFIWVERLPRDSNGKIDRKALRDRPSEVTIADFALATPLERSVMEVFGEVLGASGISLDADFFALGGRSLQALQAAHRLERILHREVPVSALFRHSTVAALAQSLAAPAGPPPRSAGQDPLSPLLTLQPGRGPALCCIHPADGLSWCYMGLARHLPGIPIHGIQARGLKGENPLSFDVMVRDYLGLIRSAQPSGPYRLLGWSSGGGVAHAIACALRAAGEEVTLLAMLDSYPADIWDDKPEPTEIDALVSLLDDLDASPLGPDGRPLGKEQLLARIKMPGSSLFGFDDESIIRMSDAALHSMRIYRRAQHPVFDGELVFFRAARRPDGAPDWRSWAPYVSGNLLRIDIDCHHLAMCQPIPLAEICRTLAPRLRGDAR